ncbi:hypothetical protein B0J14DRAFT_25282 [Halenospora varia]|nr:hypothetical protein B0J14DRAFT_25282 [Halenospora varia]
MEFFCACSSLVLTTHTILLRYQEFLRHHNIPNFTTLSHQWGVLKPIRATTALDEPTLWRPHETTELSRASDLTLLISVCVSGALMTQLYHHSRGEKYHKPLVLAASGLTALISHAFRAPGDVSAFVLFPWMIFFALGMSRVFSGERETSKRGIRNCSGTKREDISR